MKTGEESHTHQSGIRAKYDKFDITFGGNESGSVGKDSKAHHGDFSYSTRDSRVWNMVDKINSQIGDVGNIDKAHHLVYIIIDFLHLIRNSRNWDTVSRVINNVDRTEMNIEVIFISPTLDQMEITGHMKIVKQVIQLWNVLVGRNYYR